MPKPIRISVISTGSVTIRPQHLRSTGSPTLWWVFTSRRWSAALPINVYVVEHEKGLVIFDTGQDRASVVDRDYFPRGFVGFAYRRLARFTIGADDTLTQQLARLGYEASAVRYAVLSHLHQDHIGGLSDVQGAEILVPDEEWAVMTKPFAEADGFLRSHIDLAGLNWNRFAWDATTDESLAPFTRAKDLFGDGTVVLLPTPGHTPGSLSMLVRRADAPPVLFVGDLTYDVSLLNQELLPGMGHRANVLASTRAVLELQRRMPTLVILAAHDPAASDALVAAGGQRA